jgi:hypothetical protein
MIKEENFFHSYAFSDCAKKKPKKQALNSADAKRLWEISEDLVHLEEHEILKD